LVRVAREAGISVYVVPGPSAWAALASVAGAPVTHQIFRGFFPRSAKEQESELERIVSSSDERGTLWGWFESPQRICKTLSVIAERFPDSVVTVAKEMTKIHERYFWGTTPEVEKQVLEHVENEGEKGEWCFALEFHPASKESGSRADLQGHQSLENAVKALSAAKIKASEAAKFLSQFFGIERNEAYALFLKQSRKKNPSGA